MFEKLRECNNVIADVKPYGLSPVSPVYTVSPTFSPFPQ